MKVVLIRIILIQFVPYLNEYYLLQAVIAQNFNVVMVIALCPAGNVTAMMIAVTTATNKIAVCISSGSLEIISIHVLRLSETMRYIIIVF